MWKRRIAIGQHVECLGATLHTLSITCKRVSEKATSETVWKLLRTG